MTITHLNLSWGLYWCMVACVSGWICGVTAISQKGLALFFIRAFFERQRSKKINASPEANLQHSFNIKRELNLFRQNNPQAEDDEVLFQEHQIVKQYLIEMELKSNLTLDELLNNLLTKDGAQKNNFYYFEWEYIIPEVVRMPIISCIYCMPSVHTFFFYTALCLYKHFSWNPVEWVTIAVVCSFVAPVLYQLKKPV